MEKSKPFFGPSSEGSLWAIARSWAGTPFHLHGQIRGVGVDCIRLAVSIYQETHFLGSISLPSYTIDGGQHLGRSLVTAAMEQMPWFQTIPYKEEGLCALAPGDLLVFRVSASAVEHHVGVFLGGQERMFVNATVHDGVVIRRLGDSTWLRALRGAYRPTRTA